MPHRSRPQGKACKNNLLRQTCLITTLESNMSLAGTLYFISQHASLVSYHRWLQQFFGALTDTDRQAMITGLHAARESFPAGVK
jgi:hypothetical protein